MLELVRTFRWREVAKAVAETPGLIGVRDERGRNWLHVCCSVNPKARGLRSGDSVRTADALLHAGLDVNEAAFREGSWQATPLWHAVARGENSRLARHLLERGADPNHCLWAAAYRDDLPAVERLVAAGADLDPVAEDETPFLSAVKTSHLRAAKRLLELGANVDFQDSHGRTALHYMLRKGSDIRHLRMVIAHGARLDLADRDGATAAEIMRRKRDPALRQLASRALSTGLSS
jgi:ankyrin repeat protein